MSERLRSIVASMRVAPDAEVLEIGCGHGVAATLLGGLLTKGHLVAIDRSARMVEAARRRNALLIAAGRATFLQCEFVEFDPGARRFDHILAVRVGCFATDPVAARQRAIRWLKPGGKLHVVYDAPPPRAKLAHD